MNNLKIEILIALFTFGFVHSAVAQVEPENFELSITGGLVEKLEPETRISVGTIGTSKEFPSVTMSTSVESLPLYLPKKHFQNRYLRISFYSHSLEILSKRWVNGEQFGKAFA